ncbi:MAG: DUF305 domain-containing protein [Acidimicrobiales bacterium]
MTAEAGARRSPDGVAWWRLSARQAIALAALCFLAAAGGYALGTPRRPTEGSADVGFLRDMIVHHDQAVVMAAIALDKGTEPLVRTFAKEIVILQRYEIGIMDAYLARWGYERESGEGTAMAWMGVPVPPDEMPGLASPVQMGALREAGGRGADRLFLELMREHHRGGADMAAAAASRARDGRVRDLASAMARNQRIEINEMEAARQRLGL